MIKSMHIFIVIVLVSLLTSCSFKSSNSSRTPAQVYDQYKVQVPKGVSALLEYEQNYINRSVDESLIKAPTIQEQKVEYRPENRNWFELKTVWIPEDDLLIAKSKKSSFDNNDFIKVKNGKSYFRLIIHPESEDFYKEQLLKYERGETLLASSTSSSRTVLATDNKGKFFFAKLSLDVELGDVVRTIPKGEVARSVGFTSIIDSIDSPNENFKIIRESLGIVPKGMDRGGQILREIPPEAFKDNRQLVPLFSLYAKGPDGKSPLEKMLANTKDPETFLEEKILKPFVDAWVDWAIDENLVMEAHAQNVLIQLDKDGIPTGSFYHRDLGGFNINFDVSKYKNQIPIFDSILKDYHIKHHDEAILLSLRTYFEGGFLYNVNKELERLGHEDIDIRNNLRDLVIRKLRKKTNKKFSNLKASNLYRNIVFSVKSSRESEKSFTMKCIESLLRILAF